MVFSPSKAFNRNALHQAYEDLDENDRIRIRDLIIDYCEITQNTFYVRLKQPELYSKLERLVIARLFNKEVKQLFKPQE